MAMMYEPIRGMELVVATVSKYRGSERQNLIKLMTHAGESLSQSNAFTHLVCWKFEGRKYELAKKFKIIIVNHQWIEDCIKQRKRVLRIFIHFKGTSVTFDSTSKLLQVRLFFVSSITLGNNAPETSHAEIQTIQ